MLISTETLTSPRHLIGLGERNTECHFEVPENQVMINLDQIIKSPVSLAQDDPKLIKVSLTRSLQHLPHVVHKNLPLLWEMTCITIKTYLASCCLCVMYHLF